MTAPSDVERLMRSTRDDFEIRTDVLCYPSRYVEAVADRTVYRALSSRLTDGVAGLVGGDMLVSLIGPVQGCYAFAESGYLALDYVTAKLCPRENDVTRTAIWLLVAYLLGREPIWHLA